MLERAKRASHIESTSVTLRHHAEGMFPTAERTLDPARMFEESLTPRPELENGQDPERTRASALIRINCMKVEARPVSGRP